MTGTEPAVRLEDVRKIYQLGEPVHALDGVSLEIERGSYTAIMGPSGSGKSTLMNLVGCLDTPTAGTVVVDGRDVGSLSGRERTDLRGTEIGFVFQTFNLMPRLTAIENVALPQLFQGVGRRERLDRARELLERVGIGDRVEHYPNELSGGQRQRVALARALINDPAIVLADEPSGNLDTETEAQVLDLFDEFHDVGTTFLVVTHEPHVADRAERVIHLLDGRIERIESHEMADRFGGDGVATTSRDGADPTDSDGAPTDSDEAPAGSDGAPTDSDGAPADSDGAPAGSDGTNRNNTDAAESDDGSWDSGAR